jgi:hypothetical protein
VGRVSSAIACPPRCPAGDHTLGLLSTYPRHTFRFLGRGARLEGVVSPQFIRFVVGAPQQNLGNAGNRGFELSNGRSGARIVAARHNQEFPPKVKSLARRQIQAASSSMLRLICVTAFSARLVRVNCVFERLLDEEFRERALREHRPACDTRT